MNKYLTVKSSISPEDMKLYGQKIHWYDIYKYIRKPDFILPKALFNWKWFVDTHTDMNGKVHYEYLYVPHSILRFKSAWNTQKALEETEQKILDDLTQTINRKIIKEILHK